MRRRIRQKACSNLARTETDDKGPGSERLQHLLGQGHQPALCRAEMRQGHQQPGHHQRGPDNATMVGHDGRHHGGEPRQLSCEHTTRGTVPHGLTKTEKPENDITATSPAFEPNTFK